MTAPISEEPILDRGSPNGGADRTLFRLAHGARVFFGFILFVNGLNWWWKILPYPSIHDQLLPHTPPFVQAMLNTGFMFDFVRILELAVGAGLLINCWVPLLVVVVFPLSLGIWAVDVFRIATSLRANVMGWAVFMLNGFLLVSYFDSYLPMLVRTPVPGLFWRRRVEKFQE